MIRYYFFFNLKSHLFRIYFPTQFNFYGSTGVKRNFVIHFQIVHTRNLTNSLVLVQRSRKSSINRKYGLPPFISRTRNLIFLTKTPNFLTKTPDFFTFEEISSVGFDFFTFDEFLHFRRVTNFSVPVKMLQLNRHFRAIFDLLHIPNLLNILSNHY